MNIEKKVVGGAADISPRFASLAAHAASPLTRSRANHRNSPKQALSISCFTFDISLVSSTNTRSYNHWIFAQVAQDIETRYLSRGSRHRRYTLCGPSNASVTRRLAEPQHNPGVNLSRQSLQTQLLFLESPHFVPVQSLSEASIGAQPPSGSTLGFCMLDKQRQQRWISASLTILPTMRPTTLR